MCNTEVRAVLPDREADALSVYVRRVITPQCYLSAVPPCSWEKARYVSRPPDSPLPGQDHLNELVKTTHLCVTHTQGAYLCRHSCHERL